MFSAIPEVKFIFNVLFKLSSAKAFKLDQSKILSFGKDLKSKLSIRPQHFKPFPNW